MLRQGKLWIIPNVIIKTWKKQYPKGVNVIVFHRNGFTKPMVLVTSFAVGCNELQVQDGNHTEISTAYAIKMAETYYRRWGIEMLFKELKSYFRFEKFKLLSEEAIKKFIAIILFCHTLITILHDRIGS